MQMLQNTFACVVLTFPTFATESLITISGLVLSHHNDLIQRYIYMKHKSKIYE